MKILTLCLGNICRSPAAEGILKSIISSDHFVDSVGTGDWHVGGHPDQRSIDVCKKYGIDISQLISRQLVEKDGEDFDLVLAMDKSNIDNAKKILSTKYHHKIRLFAKHEISDPYNSALDGFEIMFENLSYAAEKLKEELEL